MEAKTRSAVKDELKHHPFEPVAEYQDFEWHYKFVKGVLEAKIAREETTEYVKPKKTMDLHEIYYEVPRS